MPDWLGVLIAILVVMGLMAVFRFVWDSLVGETCFACSRRRALEGTGRTRRHAGWDQYELKCKYCGHVVWKSNIDVGGGG